MTGWEEGQLKVHMENSFLIWPMRKTLFKRKWMREKCIMVMDIVCWHDAIESTGVCVSASVWCRGYSSWSAAIGTSVECANRHLGDDSNRTLCRVCVANLTKSLGENCPREQNLISDLQIVLPFLFLVHRWWQDHYPRQKQRSWLIKRACTLKRR